MGGNEAIKAREEIDVNTPGRNSGWPLYGGLTGCGSGITLPVFVYKHSTDIGCCRNRAVVGGYIYRGTAFPFVDGLYYYPDFAQSSYRWLRFDKALEVLASGSFTIRDAMPQSVPSWLEVSPFNGLGALDFWFARRWSSGHCCSIARTLELAKARISIRRGQVLFAVSMC